jgi:tRNA threonylcarbamoyladenosine biosynthesis protein TsaB
MSWHLSLDTATDRPTLALGSPEDPGPDAVIAHRHDLSRDIDAVARGLFAQHGISGTNLVAVVVSDGPGSFTGLRIGIAFAKGLARALGIPLLAAPSMMGAARSVASSGTVVVDYNALRGDAYRAVYQLSADGVVTLSPPAIVAAGDAAAVPGRHLIAGDAHASAAALLSLVGVPGGVTAVDDPAAWEPAYGRPAEAEARRLAAQQGPA